MLDDRNDLIDAIARELRSAPVGDSAAAKARILAAVSDTRTRHRASSTWEWLRHARTVRISPLGGFALAASVAAVVVLAVLSVERTLEHARASAAMAPREVRFVLVAPAASRVSLVGDFNGWDRRATPLHDASRHGVWTAEVPLAPGTHAYAFIINDSTWMADPSAARAPGDDFGAPNSVIVVEGHLVRPDSRRKGGPAT